jgi:hypothetical protein
MSKMGKGALAILVPFCYDAFHEWTIGPVGRSVWAAEFNTLSYFTVTVVYGG